MGVALLVLLCLIKVSCAKQKELKDVDFKIEAHIKVFETTSMDLDRDRVLIEYFSSKEKKSKLSFHARTLENNKYENYNPNLEYYSDDKGQLVRVGRSPYSKKKCELADGSILMRDLFGDSSKVESELEASNWLRPRQQVPNQAIGVSRLLFEIEANRNKMVLVDMPPKMRNHDTKKYKMSLPLNFAKTDRLTELILYYLADGDSDQTRLDIPSRIWLLLPSGCEVVIDLMLFKNIEPIEALTSGLETFTGHMSDFALPRGIGCSNKSANLQHTSMFYQDDESEYAFVEPKVVSFRMLLWAISSPDVASLMAHRFIQYDGYIRAMRYDSLGKANEESNGVEMSLIHDINANTKYMIFAPQKAKHYDANISLLVGSDNKSDCFAVRSINSEKIGFSVYEPIVPNENLVELGTGFIRGVPVKVLEHTLATSEDLPALLFEKIEYVDDETNRFHSMPMDIEEADSYTIVYYVANLPIVSVLEERNDETNDKDSTSEGRYMYKRMKDTNLVPILMQVEVYIGQSVRYRAEIFDFGWRLTESPEGDRAKDLFSLQDKCNSATLVTGMSDQRRRPGRTRKTPEQQSGHHFGAKLAMRLDHIGSMRLQDGPSLGISEWLGSCPMIRDISLLRALGSRELISVTHLSHLWTRLIGPNENAKIFAEIVVDDRIDSIQMHRLKRITSLSSSSSSSSASSELQHAIGGGSQEVDTNVVVADKTNSLRDCYWQAFKRMYSTANERGLSDNEQRATFTFCRNVCLIIAQQTTLTTETQTNEDDRVQNGKDLQDCTLMSIEFESATQSKQSASQNNERAPTSNWIYQFLSSTEETLRFPMIDLAQRATATSFAIFSIKSVSTSDYYHYDYSQTEVDESNQNPNSVALIGLGLTDVNAKVFSLDGSSDRYAVEPQETCHYKCLADIYCRSYSICVHALQVNCYTSELSFSDENMLSEIEKAKQAQTGKTLTLMSEEELPIELRMDKRCNIYNKFAIDTFRLSSSRPKTFVDANSLISVANEETCADICLSKNLQLLASTTGSFESLGSDWCASFKYLDMDAAQLSESTLRAIDANNLKHSGLCALARSPQASTSSFPAGASEQPRRPVPLMMQLFEFRYATLFETYRRIRLQVRSEGESTNKQIASAESSPEKCARMCFSQTIELSPACKSFDLIELEDSYYCVFNSIGLTEAKEQNLVSTQTPEAESSTENWVHYEPRESFASVTSSATKTEKNTNSNSDNITNIPIAKLLVFMVALASGLTIGFVATQRRLPVASSSSSSAATAYLCDAMDMS